MTHYYGRNGHIMLNPRVKILQDILLSEYPYRISKKNKKDILLKYKKEYSIGQILKAIELHTSIINNTDI